MSHQCNREGAQYYRTVAVKMFAFGVQFIDLPEYCSLQPKRVQGILK